MPDNKSLDRENLIETRLAPRWAWRIIDNCLEGENPQSENYDNIQRALHAIKFNVDEE